MDLPKERSKNGQEIVRPLSGPRSRSSQASPSSPERVRFHGERTSPVTSTAGGQREEAPRDIWA